MYLTLGHGRNGQRRQYGSKKRLLINEKPTKPIDETTLVTIDNFIYTYKTPKVEQMEEK